jgi:hypothetical protein
VIDDLVGRGIAHAPAPVDWMASAISPRAGGCKGGSGTGGRYEPSVALR